MVDDTTYHTHVEESHMVETLKSLTNPITSDASNITNLTLTNANMEEQLKVALAQNNVFI